jgi:hypothetical protein
LTASEPITTEPTTLVESQNIPKIESLPPTTPILLAKRRRGRLRKYPLQTTHFPNIEIFIGMEKPPTLQFATSRQEEINGLIKRGVCALILPSDILCNVRVFGSRFVDEIKNPGTDKAFEKSRLVIQVYNDSGKVQVLTQSPTIQRVSQRILLAIAATMLEYNVYLRDITQAYTQSTIELNRDFYAIPPKDVP